MMKQITAKRLEHYFSITGKALKMAKEGITKNPLLLKQAEDFLDMAERYFSDAHHFKDKGDFVNAYGALNYAHAFLDAGARIKLFEVNDSELFAAD